ncbi:MAG: hypothetical protein R3E89_05060 [Thiolinea sp.]
MPQQADEFERNTANCWSVIRLMTSVSGICAGALLSFDEAAVFTIHGFCQRALQENA